MSKNILKLHHELLDKKRQEVLQKLIPLASDFVLGGGTALALQMAQRKSFDFDFFSSSQIPQNLLEKLSIVFQVENVVNGIKITFLRYPFKPLFKHLKTTVGLKIFSILDS